MHYDKRHVSGATGDARTAKDTARRGRKPENLAAGPAVTLSVFQFPGVAGRKAAQSITPESPLHPGDPARIPAAGNETVMMHVNGNYWAEQTFPVTEDFADAVFMIGGNRPEYDIPRISVKVANAA